MNAIKQPVTAGLFPLSGAAESHSEISTPEFFTLAQTAGLKQVVIKWLGGADSAPTDKYANRFLPDGPVYYGGVVWIAWQKV